YVALPNRGKSKTGIPLWLSFYICSRTSISCCPSRIAVRYFFNGDRSVSWFLYREFGRGLQRSFSLAFTIAFYNHETLYHRAGISYPFCLCPDNHYLVWNRVYCEGPSGNAIDRISRINAGV